jgi:hypothetical protein
MYVFVLTAVILFQEQICCCSTPGQDRRTESGDTKGSGLVGGHAYSLLDAREVFGHKLVRVRNPWGSFEWDGDWSDHSSLWTPELKQAVNFEAEDDGSFWMCLRDFREGFEDVTVCYKHDSLKQSWKNFISNAFCHFDSHSGKSFMRFEYVTFFRYSIRYASIV